jgi:hypothetical protein
MKAKRTTARDLAGWQTFEFVRRHPENLLRVEISQQGVVIRAARDNLLPSEREVFVRYLVNEGFISEKYRRFSGANVETSDGVQWILHNTKPRTFISTRSMLRARPFLIPVLAYKFLAWCSRSWRYF